jgi:hypothetical protein
MKAETLVLIIVCAATTLSASLLSLTTSLAQWSNSDASPTRIGWTIIIGGAVIQGLNQLTAFLSKRFADWVTGRNAPSGDTQLFTKTETTKTQ